jgi:hypothetical protein
LPELNPEGNQMKQLISIVVAGIFAMAAQLTAQSAATPQNAQPQGQPAAPARSVQGQVVLTGCVELESDYRKRMAAGRGGALGTGVGAADEFVLTNVRPPAAEIGTSGSGTREAGGGIYTLTGPSEKELKRSVGRQIEVVGTIENAGKKSTGAQLTDISDLPRVQMQTWHPVADYCPAKE